MSPVGSQSLRLLHSPQRQCLIQQNVYNSTVNQIGAVAISIGRQSCTDDGIGAEFTVFLGCAACIDSSEWNQPSFRSRIISVTSSAGNLSE